MELSQPVSVLKNVGVQRLTLLNRLQIFTVEDLILHFPRDYQDRSKMVAPSEVVADEVNTVSAVVTKEAENTGVYGKIATKLTLSDESGALEVVWFNQPYLKNSFQKNERYIFTGKVVLKRNKLQMQSPDFEKTGENASVSFGRIVPLYPSTLKLSQKLLRGLIQNALDGVSEQLVDFLPPSIRLAQGLCGRAAAISNIHFPPDGNSFFEARRRLVFEELFLMQTALFKMKGIVKRESAFVIDQISESALLGLMPFDMTRAQKRVMGEIKADFQSGFVMNRLIQGDVGSGKTAVAMAAAYIAMQSGEGAQAALMAPTEVLAVQHYKSCKPVFEALGMQVSLLSGSLKAKEKQQVHESIASGETRLVIGTHAIIQEKVLFHDLRLVITDEQHRFGVRQRTSLSQKGHAPHVLIMTATPIPRTLGLILYGDMDVSIIDEMPPGRMKIETYAVTSAYRGRIYAFIAKAIDAGRQAYIICPMIEESEKTAFQAVLTYVSRVREALPHVKIECLHGKMKPDVKTDVMQRFEKGDIDVIVATTVIEVGVNVPNATVMAVENAERFGLSQLHQLRGRVGRGAAQSTCVLVTDAKSDVCRQRMKAMTETNDGFAISEMDLKLRGPGDFFGTKQHGLPELRIANLYRDLDVLKLAQDCSAKLLAVDEQMEKEENRLLAKEVNAFIRNQEKKFGL